MIQIFNPKGIDSIDQRKIWKGNTTNIVNLNNVRYQWGNSLWRQMRQNFWIAEKVDLTLDRKSYKDLTDRERTAYKGILGYLTFLDSVQVANLPQLKIPITASEISQCFSEQISQEQLHAQSYSYVIQSIIPESEQNEIFNYWRDDKVLFDRISTIASYYQSYADDPTLENYFVSLFADYLLEGLYFYSAFNYFYTLVSRSLMTGTGDIIRYIHRDERTHVLLLQKLIVEGLKTFPHSIEQLTNMVKTATEQEILWNNHITNGQILGITESSIEQYCKYIANLRMKSIGLLPLYPDVNKNPYKHLDRIADIGQEASTKGNFFEVTVTSYSTSNALNGWENF